MTASTSLDRAVKHEQNEENWHEIVQRCDQRGNKERSREEEVERGYLLGLVSAAIKRNSKLKVFNNYFFLTLEESLDRCSVFFRAANSIIGDPDFNM